jgi:predicted phosphodiesterase
MRFAIIADIHSNLEALASVFLDLHNNNEKIDKILIPGDIVGYGANPNECCAIIRFLKNGNSFLKNEIQAIIQEIDINDSDKKNIINYILSVGKKAIVIAGNHDKAVIGQPSFVSEMTASADKAVIWTTRVLRKVNAQFLNSLWLRKKLRGFGIELVHSTPVYPQGYQYLKNASTLNYDLLYSSVTFAGHTHRPAAYKYTSQKRDVAASVFIPIDQFDIRLMMIERKSMVKLEDFDVVLNSGQRYYINPGSVGQPRDGTPKASYMIYDTDLQKIFLKRAEYNKEAAKAKILKAKLPFELADRVIKGI